MTTPSPAAAPNRTSDGEKGWGTKRVPTPTLLSARLKRVLALPYIVGTAWACLLPTASILTGDFSKPRGWYVDENSLETGNIRVDHKYKPNAGRRDSQMSGNATLPLCDLLIEDMLDKDNIECLAHGSTSDESISATAFPSFNVVKILPTGNTLNPSNEAIVLVASFPSSGNWVTSQLHSSLLELIRRLSSSESTNWLAKTIYLVAPTSEGSALIDVLSAFLEAYSGSYSQTAGVGKPSTIEPLPPKFATAMIRNLLVLDAEASSDDDLPKDEVRILAQGNHGVLPNLDLAFVTMSVFSRTPNTGMVGRQQRPEAPALLMHPYSREARKWQALVKERIDAYSMTQAVETYSTKLGNLFLFCKHMFWGPYAAHSLALDRGIDAITIQGRYPNGTNPSTFAVGYMNKLEILLRGLSNLHERLHHSTTLYLLPSPKTFVKHEEYLVPNLLLLIPVVIRAALLGLFDIRRFDIQIMGWILLITLGATLCVDAYVVQQKEIAQRNSLLCLTFLASFGVFYDKVLSLPRNRRDAIRSAQLIVCLMTVYAHVPICFGNVAMSYPSALFWAPGVSFPCFSRLHSSKIGTFCMFSWLALAGSLLFSEISTTPYFRFLFFPLHLALCLSFTLGMLGSGIPQEDIKNR